jgi:hypothetical protein
MKLNHKKLPAHQAFYSSLKNKNITPDEYKYCKQVWKKNKMKTFKDFLIWYNDLDVIPFVQAIEKMFTFYRSKNLDMFKDGLSVPSLSSQYMFKSNPEARFWTFDEHDKDLYYTFRNNMVGGPSIIFNRYHEADKTKIRGGKICKKVVGYDANALYLWAIAQEMPTGKYTRPAVTKSIEQYKNDIMNDLLFGFIECDLHVPEHLKEKFSEMTPIFKNIVLEHKDLTDEMKGFLSSSWKQRSLIGSMKGEKILLYTPLLKFYIRHGLEITKIHQIVAYEAKRCFEKFTEEVSDARREGDIDPSKKIIGDTCKLIGNSSFGRTIMNKEQHTSVKFVKDSEVMNMINDPFFKTLNELHDSNEVILTKKKIKMDLPQIVGSAIFQLAKLRMLEFYYDFIDKYVDRSDFEFIEMDTDSNYMAISADKLEDVIKPKMKKQYDKEYKLFFPAEKCEEKCKKCDQCKLAMYERRTAGLFKIEWEGLGMIALNSKCYYGWSDTEKDKNSCRGVNKRTNDITKDIYMNVLTNKQSVQATNKGFRAVNGMIRSYEQTKTGWSYVYTKRKVLEDGRTTIPLDI